MSPELQRLLEAYHEKLTCGPDEKQQRVATFERLFADALYRCSGASRDELLAALKTRYSDFRRARKKLSTLPPKA
ncbi:MAG TPA: hypothetical protein VGH42_01590 [Verrucomicrobiae bacterium]|jgi:hypothetical protein